MYPETLCLPDRSSTKMRLGPVRKAAVESLEEHEHAGETCIYKQQFNK